jgi:hypothetical protein
MGELDFGREDRGRTFYIISFFHVWCELNGHDRFELKTTTSLPRTAEGRFPSGLSKIRGCGRAYSMMLQNYEARQ